MNKRIVGVLSLVGITVEYLILRFPLFWMHGMKQWPFILFIVGAVVITISGIVFSVKVLPIITAIGYMLTYLIGYLFQFNYGIGLNSMWIIWTCCYIFIIVIEVIRFIVGKRKSGK